jgi:hypothetical protein
MTVRDHIAWQLFRDMAASGQQPPSPPQEDAEEAYVFADALIERSKQDAEP